MKRAFMLVTLLILLSSTALAAQETIIFNDWIAYNGEFEHDGETYRIISSNVASSDPEDGQILIKKGVERYIIPFGDCIDEVLYEYCFENRSFEKSEVDIDSQGVLQPALKLRLVEKELEVDFDLKKTISQTKFLVGQTAEVEITLENQGDIDLTNVKFVEEVPDNFIITKSSHTFYGNRLEVNMNLFSGSVWTATYTIKAVSAQDVEYASSVTYSALNATITKEFGEKKLTFDESHEFSKPKLDKEYVRLDKDTLTFEIENTDSQDITLESIEVDASPKVILFAKKNMIQQSTTKVVSKTLTVSPDETKDVQVEVSFPNVGNYTVSYVAQVSARNEIFTYNDSFDVEVTLDLPTCVIDIPDEVNASSVVKTNIILENGEDEPFYEIQGEYSLLNEKGEYSLSNILRDSSIIGERVDLVIPFQLEESTVELEHKAKFRTVDNKYFSCQVIKEITVKPAQQLIAMNTYFKDDSTPRNATTVLVVELENILNDPITEQIDLYFSSIQASAPQKRLDGLTTKQTIEVEVSTYEFLRANNATVTTNLKIPALNEYADSTTATIAISNPYTGNLTVWELQEQQQDELQKIVQEKEKERQQMSLIDKIVDYLKNFFK